MYGCADEIKLRYLHNLWQASVKMSSHWSM